MDYSKKMLAGSEDLSDVTGGATIRRPKRLRALEVHYARLVSRMSAFVFEMQPDGRLTFVNDAIASLTGYPVPGLLDHGWQQLLLPAGGQERLAALRARLNAGDVSDAEVELRSSDGSPLILHLNTANSYTDDGRLAKIAGFAVDITERRKAESGLEDITRRLRESEGLFHSFFEQSQDGFLLADEQFRIVAWNPAQERITGLSREQVLGRSVLEVQLELMPERLRTPARLEQIRALMDNLLNGDRPSAAYGPHQATVQRNDGTQQIVDQYIFPIQIAHRRLVCGLCRDVTEQRRSQEQVAYQAMLLANVNDAVIATDASGVITAWNRAAIEIFGWTAEEAIGRQVEELLYPQDPESERAVVLPESGRYRGELLQLHKDGRVIPIEITRMALVGEEGQVTGYVSVNRDISERQQAQQKLVQQSQHLQVLHEIDEAILSARNPAEIAEAAAQGLLRVIDAMYVDVALWHPERAELEVLANAGLVNPGVQPGSRIAAGGWPWYTRVRQGQIVIDEDLTQQTDLSPAGQAATALGIRSQVVIPLIVGGQTIGHLSLSRRSAGRLADEDLALAKQIADSLAVAVHYAGLLEAERQARQRLETLQAANAALTQSLDLEAVLGSLLNYLGELIPYDTANVMLSTGDAMVAVCATQGYERWTDPALSRRIAFDVHTNPIIREVLSSQRSILVSDTARSPGWQRLPGAEHVQSWLGVPLVVGGKTLGLFSVDKAGANFFRPEHVRLAEALAPQAAVAIQNARLYAEVRTGREQLQALSRRLVELQEEERRALSRDLHDTAGQSITALKLGLGSLKREDGSAETVGARADELIQLTDMVSEDLHRLAVNLRPSSLDRYGLVPALEQLLTELRKKTGLTVEFLAQGMEGNRLPAGTETALYRIVQEALTNCTRYAQAAGVCVLVQRDGDHVQVIVEDDGRGFHVEEALHSGRLGLLGMRERAEMLGGTLEIESSPDHGACIYVTVPAQQTYAEGNPPER